MTAEEWPRGNSLRVHQRIIMSIKSLSGLIRAAAFAVAAWGSAAHAAPVYDAMPVEELVKSRTVVLTHGYFADGSSWHKVIEILQDAGVKVVAVQNPMATLADDVEATRRIIDQQTGPVVLVAHSWGGVVITEAGANPKVVSLVYVAGFAPDVGQSINTLLAPFPAPAWVGNLVADDVGNLRLDQPGFLKYFAPDLPRWEAKDLSATQGAPAGSTLGAVVGVAAWHTKPVWYVMTQQDQIVYPALQAQMAAAMSAKVTKIQSSHAAMLSHPERVAQVILEAVRHP